MKPVQCVARYMTAKATGLRSRRIILLMIGLVLVIFVTACGSGSSAIEAAEDLQTTSQESEEIEVDEPGLEEFGLFDG